MSNAELADSQQVLLFTMDEPRYALELAVVERVVQAVEIMPLPKAPPFVVGVINVQGEIIPVMNIRACFGLPPRALSVNDQFILARTSRRRVALMVEAVSGIRRLAERERVAADEMLPGTGYLRGVAKVDGMLVLICDLDQILPFEIEPVLQATVSADRTLLADTPLDVAG